MRHPSCLPRQETDRARRSESARHSRVRQYWAAVAVLVAEHQAEPRKLQCLWLFFELSRGCAEIVAPSRSWFGVSPGVLSCGAGPRAVHQLAVPNAAELLLLIGEEYHRAGMPDREIIARQESCAILRERPIGIPEIAICTDIFRLVFFPNSLKQNSRWATLM